MKDIWGYLPLYNEVYRIETWLDHWVFKLELRKTNLR